MTAEDPFDDLPRVATQCAGIPAWRSIAERRPASAGRLRRVRLPPPAPAPAPVRAEAWPDELDLAPAPAAGRESLDQMFGLPQGSGQDPFAPGHPLGDMRPEGRPIETVDPLVALGAAPTPRPTAAPQLRSCARDPWCVSASRSAARAGARAAEKRAGDRSARDGRRAGSTTCSRRAGHVRCGAACHRAAARAAAAGGAPASADHDDALLRAFLNGAGLGNFELPGGLTPELMDRLGRLLHSATRGTLDLLVARALTKREVQAELTMIAAQANNPLKFLPSVEIALQHLLLPQGRGFMAPLAAMDDAYDDLRAHQFGFVAGMRAALAGVLARFDPVALTARLTEKSMIDSLVPSHRKAKLWELFNKLYGDIAREAEDDFHKLFGKEFLRAYEEQVTRFRERAAKDPPA